MSIDIIPAASPEISAYDLVFIPGLVTMPEALMARLGGTGPVCVVGPRANAKTHNLSTPVPLPPNIPGLEAKISRVETLRPDSPERFAAGGAFKLWREHIESTADVLETDIAGAPLMVRSGAVSYLAAWPDDVALDRIIARAALEAGIKTEVLPDDIRIRETLASRYVFNHGPDPVDYEGTRIPPAGFHRQRL